MTSQRSSPSLPLLEPFATQVRLMMEIQAKESRESEVRNEREKNDMGRDMMESRIWAEREDRYEFIIGDDIEPVNIDYPRGRNLQAGGGRPGQGGQREHAVWQAGGEARHQEMARDQDLLSHRREENQRLGSARFSSMESNQEPGEEDRGRGGGELFNRQKTEEEREKRLRANAKSRMRRQRRKEEEKNIINGNDSTKKMELEQKRLKINERQKRNYKQKIERKEEIMKGDDPIKKRKVEQERLKRNRWNREWYQRTKSRNTKLKLGKKQQEAEFIEKMEEDDLLVRSTVRSKMFRKEKTNNRFQQKTKEWRKTQTQVKKDEENDEENDEDEDEDESEDEMEGYWQEEQDDE